MSGNESALTLAQACEHLHCSRTWLRTWLQRNPQFGFHIGREYRFTPGDLAAIREALKCPSGLSKHGTDHPTGTCAEPSVAGASTRARALISAQKRKKSERVEKLNSSRKRSTVVALSPRSGAPPKVT
jgi:hypothetical protein